MAETTGCGAFTGLYSTEGCHTVINVTEHPVLACCICDGKGVRSKEDSLVSRVSRAHSCPVLLAVRPRQLYHHRVQQEVNPEAGHQTLSPPSTHTHTHTVHALR